jgi:hypothetical protein
VLIAAVDVGKVLQPSDLVQGADAILELNCIRVHALFGRRSKQAINVELDKGLIGTWHETLQSSL